MLHFSYSMTRQSLPRSSYIAMRVSTSNLFHPESCNMYAKSYSTTSCVGCFLRPTQGQPKLASMALPFPSRTRLMCGPVRVAKSSCAPTKWPAASGFLLERRGGLRGNDCLSSPALPSEKCVNNTVEGSRRCEPCGG